MSGTVIDNCDETQISKFVSKSTLRISDYDAIYIHTGSIKKFHLNFKQIILGIFEALIRKDNGGIFFLHNNDSVVIYNKKNTNEIKGLLIKLKYVFNDDLSLKKESSKENYTFISYYNLSSSLREFREEIRKNLEEEFKENSSSGTKIVSNVGTEKINPFTKEKLKDITPAILGKLQKSLSSVDFSNLIRRQSVCVVIGDTQPKVLFNEVYVSINNLTDSLIPGVDLTSNPWLFQNLTEALDKRMLYMIRKHDDAYLRNNFSINLNVSTILSEEFLTFDEHFSPSSKSTITIEFNLLDVMSDIKTFMLVQAFLQYQGYKTCLDGVTVDKLKYLKFKQINCDLVKLAWQPNFMEEIKEDKYFNEEIDDAERAKIVITKIDNQKAIDAGKSLGINLFHGRHIQKLLTQRR